MNVFLTTSPNQPTISRRTELVLLVVILLITAVLRIGWPGLTEFKADEAHLLELALEMAKFETFPLRGISSSVGFPNFPMSVWLYALPLFLWKSVLSATIFTGLLNTLAVLGCYWLVRRYWGAEAALTAALLFAVSPWAIHHSRKIWAQNLLPVFVVGWGITAVLTFVESRPKFIILNFLCLAISAQAHLAAFALIPATALIMLVFWRRIPWKETLIGLLLAALTFLPFIIYLLTDGLDYVNLDAVSTDGSTIERSWSFEPILHAWRLASGWQIHALAGGAFRDYLATVPSLTLVYWVWGLLFIAGLIFMMVRIWQANTPTRDLAPSPSQGEGWGEGDTLQPSIAQNAQIYTILLIWLIIPILFFAPPFLPVELHYFLPIYPVPYMIMGIFVGHLVTRWRRAVIVVLLITAVFQLLIWGNLQTFLSQNIAPGGFGTPLSMQLATTDEARRLFTETAASEILIAGDGDNPELDTFAATNAVLLHDLPHRFVNVGDTAVFPKHNTIVLLDPSAGGLSDLYLQSATEIIDIPLRNGEGILQVLIVPETAVPQPDHTIEPPAILTNWTAFIGYDTPDFSDDGTANWRVYATSGEPSSNDYHLFNHLLDENGERIAQVDSSIFPASQWQENDIIITQSRLEWPTNATIMRIGMYQYPSLTPVLIFDVAGNPYTDGIEINLP